MTLSIDPEIWRQCKEVQTKTGINLSYIAEQAFRLSLPLWQKVAEQLTEETEKVPIFYPSLSSIPAHENYDVVLVEPQPRHFVDSETGKVYREKIEPCFLVEIFEREPVIDEQEEIRSAKGELVIDFEYEEVK